MCINFALFYGIRKPANTAEVRTLWAFCPQTNIPDTKLLRFITCITYTVYRGSAVYIWRNRSSFQRTIVEGESIRLSIYLCTRVSTPLSSEEYSNYAYASAEDWIRKMPVYEKCESKRLFKHQWNIYFFYFISFLIEFWKILL